MGNLGAIFWYWIIFRLMRMCRQQSHRTQVFEPLEHLTELTQMLNSSDYIIHTAEREAACSSISELVQKIDKIAVLPHISQLLGTLNTCAKDQTWSVRDGGF
jgi:uncharacterized protein with von Willebrand factor type A (vWA) domain